MDQSQKCHSEKKKPEAKAHIHMIPLYEVLKQANDFRVKASILWLPEARVG